MKPPLLPLVAAALAFATTCSSDRPGSTATAATTAATSTTERAASDAELSELAGVLVGDHDAGGADVTAEVPYGSGRVRVTGVVDWRNGVGDATVTATTPGAGDEPADSRFVFGRDVVVEEIPALAGPAEAAGLGPARWTIRELRPAASPLDTVFSVVLAASSATHENLALLAQDHPTWVGRDTIDGVAVNGIRRRDVTFWIGDGLLRRIDATVAAHHVDVSITFGDHGPRSVAEPDPALVLDAATADRLLGR